MLDVIEQLRRLPPDTRVALRRQLEALEGEPCAGEALDEDRLRELLARLRIRHRVVITGMGAITPLALNVQDTWQGLIEGRSGIDYFKRIDASQYPAKFGGEEVLQAKEKDEFGHVRLGGVGERLAKIIGKKTGYETRHVVLGHTQRAGSPTAWDRVLGTRYGIAAAELVIKGDWGKMVALQGDDILAVPLSAAVEELKGVAGDFLEKLELFFA